MATKSGPAQETTITTHAINITKGGYCLESKTFQSLRPTATPPPPHQPLSITQFILSLLHSSAIPTSQKNFLIMPSTRQSLTYSQAINQIYSLSSSLKSHYNLNKNDVSFILCPPSLHVPILYFSLLYLGVTISPANPLSSKSELTHQIQLSKPKIAFATSQTAHKLPSFPLGTVLIDSPEFITLLTLISKRDTPTNHVEVSQSDMAAILYSSGTTGRVKGVSLTHRNVIAPIAAFQKTSAELDPHAVSLLTLPLFHVFGFFLLINEFRWGRTLVLTERFDFEQVLKLVERYRVSDMPVSPTIILRLLKSDLTNKYDLSSLRRFSCGGAPLSKEVAEKFKRKFPQADIMQGYGLTEAGAVSRIIGPEECNQHASVGRLSGNMEAKIVDPLTGEAFGPGKRGELWLRGPSIMKGYVGDDKATAETLDSEGWLKTGDLCFFDSEGFLYIVDRLKELIKYKAYQVPPVELEHLLLSNPEIADAAVIPYPDEEAGQIPMACVVRKPGSSITEAQIMDSIAKQVAPYKKIRRVAFTDAIPRSPAGKILRRELISHALSGALSKL
ncbi:PREDICTED: 4-coumarate--CoA ligase-like 9 [Populus euphratica]|uniref:4-coumarate--CoA ligase-like 9 n=1 Tax=Populus euphratica TaxID=75702 RepID=A0AAJ6VAG4_POPEU|nr:PREDICTED: 4-coumarate--CoA ligase-like 9 [Populus euphratica]